MVAPLSSVGGKEWNTDAANRGRVREMEREMERFDSE